MKMLSQAAFTLVTTLTCALLFGCSGPSSAGNDAANPALAQPNSRESLLASTFRNSLSAVHMPRGSKVYASKVLVVVDGDRFAFFPASAKMSRTNTSLSVVDPSSNETIAFSSRAVTYIDGSYQAISPEAKTFVDPSAVRIGTVNDSGSW
jgi:hypothetical protein